jgi:chitin disaccharide deacetylase
VSAPGRADIIRVVLCADDYGLAPGLGEGIRSLLAQGRLSAVSCMSLSPFWPEEARRLEQAGTQAEIGLHLTLTDQPPLGPMPRLAPAGRLPRFGALLRAAYLRRLPAAEIKAEALRQLDAFEKGMGRPPDFLDGHHHVQQLPVVRDVVLEVWRARLPRRSWVRTCAEPLAQAVRRRVAVPRALAFAFPGRALRRRLRAAGVPTNHGYSGAYDFSGQEPYGQLFDRFLQGARDGFLVNCHPGRVDEALRRADSLTDQREAELSFLQGSACAEVLQRRRVVLGGLLQPA